MSFLWDPNHPRYYNKLHKLFPTTAANNRWITARSPFAAMLAVLSERTPQVEQNLALLLYGTLLKSARGLTVAFRNFSNAPRTLNWRRSG